MVQVAPDTPVVGSAKVKSRDPFGYWVGACAGVAHSQDLAASGAGVGFMFENSQDLAALGAAVGFLFKIPNVGPKQTLHEQENQDKKPGN